MKKGHIQKSQPTTFDKLERYITKIAEEYGATIEKSPRSRYFKFNDRVLRLSNHIGKNSSGAISIIVPYGTTSKDDVFGARGEVDAGRAGLVGTEGCA